VTVIPAQAALALGVAKGKFCWPVVASLRRDPAARNRYCQTRGHARCVSGEAHVQSAEMRAFFDTLFSGKKKRKQDFERGRDLDGPDRDYTSKGKAAKLASDLEAELRAIPPGWPAPAGQRSGPPGPRSYEGFYPPGHFRSKADPWLLAQHAYLLDALEHGEACTVKPPKALLFSDHEGITGRALLIRAGGVERVGEQRPAPPANAPRVRGVRALDAYLAEPRRERSSRRW